MSSSQTLELVPLDVSLVCMPVAAVQRPSIGLGELKASLVAADISTRVQYANLMFLDHVGLENYELFEIVRTEDSLGDWLFAGIAFPDFEPDHDRYIERLLDRNPLLAKRLDGNANGRLMQLRASMPAFVDQVVDRVVADQPRIVGATSTFQQHVAALAMLRRLRERAPDTITMMGGANCETVMGRATHRNYPWVDYVVSGEAEGLIADLCHAVLAQGREADGDSLPRGVLAPVHRETGYPVEPAGDGVPRATTLDMRTVPMPNYDDYFSDLEQIDHKDRIRPGLPVETARGCWWGERMHCTFCGLNGGGMTFREKPAEDVIDQLDELAAKYQINAFEAVDNIMAANYLDTVVPALAEAGRDYRIFYETKANLKPEEVAKLAAAGVRWIQPGIESLHTGVLKLMRKGVTASNNIRLLRSCREMGLRLSWSILCGFPGEKDEWYFEMADWMPSLAHLQPARLVMLRYDRYSPYFDQAREFGLDLVPSELYKYVYPHTEEELREQVYFFEDRKLGDQGRTVYRGDLAERPGIAAARDAARSWIEAWASGDMPTLAMEEIDGQVAIYDTRPIALIREQLLNERSSIALLAAIDMPPRHRWVETLSQQGFTENQIDEALGDLLHRRLVLEIDQRVIALPLRVPVASLPKAEDFPGGMVQRLPREDGGASRREL